MPRDYTHPDGPTFDLAVVVVRNPRQPALPDPVVHISGGPGAPLTVYAGFQARHPYAEDRDLVLIGMPWSRRVARAWDAFLAACDVDPSCEAALPDLPGAYRQALARLDQDAPFIALPPVLHVPGDRVRLTPSLFEEVVGRLVYYPPTYAGLPHLIAATRDGDLKLVGSAITTLLAGVERNGHEGPLIAVECRDRPRWRQPAALDAS